MKKSLLVLDIDGTLTNSKKEITAPTKAAIRKIQENGVSVAIASGRPTPGTKMAADALELDKFGGYVLSFNGGRLLNWKTKQVVMEEVISPELAADLCDDANEYGLGILTYDANGALAGTDIDEYMELEARINHIPLEYVGNFRDVVDYPVNKCLMTGEPEYLEKVEKELREKYEGRLNVFRSEPFFLELMPPGIDKAAVLERFIPMIGVEREQVICCGDGFNDLTMIKFAGVGVAMANAREEVKAAADYITASNDEDGIVKVIEKFYKNFLVEKEK